MSENSIPQIYFNSSDTTSTDLFKKLYFLAINRNKIEDVSWKVLVLFCRIPCRVKLAHTYLVWNKNLMFLSWSIWNSSAFSSQFYVPYSYCFTPTPKKILHSKLLSVCIAHKRSSFKAYGTCTLLFIVEGLKWQKQVLRSDQIQYLAGFAFCLKIALQ